MVRAYNFSLAHIGLITIRFGLYGLAFTLVNTEFSVIFSRKLDSFIHTEVVISSVFQLWVNSPYFVPNLQFPKEEEFRRLGQHMAGIRV